MENLLSLFGLPGYIYVKSPSAVMGVPLEGLGHFVVALLADM
jgi:hypothetical protein